VKITKLRKPVVDSSVKKLLKSAKIWQKLQTRRWLTRAHCVPGHHAVTATRRRMWSGSRDLLEFYTPEIFLERLKLQTSHCVYWLATCSISLVMTGCPPSERALLGSCDPFLHFGAQNISLVWIKLDISNVVCRLNVKILALHMLKFCSMEVHSGSCDLSKIWEISANILEMVHNRDRPIQIYVEICSYNGRLIGNLMCPIEWHQRQ